MPSRKPGFYDFPPPVKRDTFGHLLAEQQKLTLACRDCGAEVDSAGIGMYNIRLRHMMVHRAHERWNRVFRCPFCGGKMKGRVTVRGSADQDVFPPGHLSG